MTATATSSREPPRLGMLPLIAVGAGIFVFAHDFVAVSIAVPQIQEHFSAGLQTAQWTITVFSIGMAVAVVPAGRLADLFGPARTFIAGALAFAATSALVALAPAIWLLLAGRALEGLAAGVVWIAAIPLVFTAFGPARAALAGAFLIGIGGIGTALGPIDAGLLIDWAGWRASFAFNIPICLFAALVMLRRRPSEKRTEAGSIDWAGSAVLAAGLMALLITLRYAPTWDWGSAATIGGFAAAAALMLAFVLQQRARGAAALVPPAVAGNPRFALAFACETLLGLGYFAVIGFGPQIFDRVLGVDPIQAGLMLAPAMAMFSLAAALTGRLCAGLPPQVSLPSAGAVVAAGALLLALMPDSPDYLALLPGLLLVGFGTGSAFSALVTIGVSALPEDQGGLAGGLLYMAQLGGGAIGLGAVTAVVTEVAAGTAGGAASGAALVQGVQGGFLVAAAVVALGALVALLGYGLLARRAPALAPP